MLLSGEKEPVDIETVFESTGNDLMFEILPVSALKSNNSVILSSPPNRTSCLKSDENFNIPSPKAPKLSGEKPFN